MKMESKITVKSRDTAARITKNAPIFKSTSKWTRIIGARSTGSKLTIRHKKNLW